LVDRLAAHRTVGQAPRTQLAWLAAHGELVGLEANAVVTRAGESPAGLWIVLSGHLSIRVDRGAGPRRVMEWTAGDVTGVLPYSRMGGAPGAVRTDTPSELLLVPRDHFPALIRECHEVVAILVHVMIDRARHFTSSDLHVEKMMSLGKLAAGLAHELNNPASAVDRAAGALAGHLAEAERAAEALAEAHLSPADLAEVRSASRMCGATNPGLADSPIARADREDALTAWLERHGAATRLAESLSDSAVTLDALDGLAGALDGARLRVALEWMAASCAVRRLAAEIAMASARIHHLVDAVKGFTYLDQATAPKPVDIGRGLADTLVVLRAKIRAQAATVDLAIAPGRRAQPGLGQLDRQCPGRRRARGSGADHGRRRGPVRGRARHRQRSRHPPGGAGEDLRPVLHDQADRPGHGPRTRHRPPDRPGPQWSAGLHHRARAHGVPRDAAADTGRGMTGPRESSALPDRRMEEPAFRPARSGGPEGPPLHHSQAIRKVL
jgi:CRP-like cAMP-binding protein